MRLMIASDIHGSLAATRRLLAAFDVSGARWLVLLGDFLNHGPRNPLPEDYRPADVAAALNAYRQRIIAVRGNCDSEVDEMLLDFPSSAPWQQVLLGETRRLFLTHGHLYHPAHLPPLAPGDAFLYGHTHIPQAERAGEHILFNPGSVSLPKGGFPASYGLLADGRLQVLSLDGGETIAQVAITF
ncbi:Phosphodiesterase, MJ0936 family [Sodalis praecaptivus]|uniref:Phosphoesterase n=1 Tax=Sodalis praecaptivus TaxID=1239307 RepID=W0HW05_9GAMM|nr:phosphodiesterase [Sodalis praecaptivus]AHF76390.1 Phosphodiesterase, MJ0936 family [Sodalis praecaptivus]